MHIHGCQKIWTIPIPKFRPFVYFLFLKKRGVDHISGGAEKGGGLFGTSIRTMSYIGYPSLRGFKPFMVQDLLKRR